MVVEAEVHENCYSEMDCFSEIKDNEASDEDLALSQEMEDSQKTNFNSTPFFFVHELNKTLKLTTDILDCHKILVYQKIDSVVNTVRSWLSKVKVPTKDMKSRQYRRLPGYAGQFEKVFVDKETQLVCRKSKHLPKQICLPRNCFIEWFNVVHDHRLSGHPGSEKLFNPGNDFSTGLECVKG